MDREIEMIDELHSNKEHFLARVQQELKRAQRYLCFVSYINIDTAKYNKTGEVENTSSNTEFYRKLRKLLRKSLRQTDIISGFNKGNICILLVETHKDGANKVGNRLHETIKYLLHEMFNSPLNWKVNISSGSFPDNENTPNSFYNRINSIL